MSRVTITLPDELHRALKRAAATRGVSIGDLVAESLEQYGIKSEKEAAALVAAARERAAMSEEKALRLALSETRRARRS